MKKSKKAAKRVLSFALTVTLFAGCAILLSGCKKKKTVATDPADILKEAAVETADLSGMDFTFSSRDKDGSYDEKTATRVVFSEKAVAVNGAGAGAEGTALTIDAAGTYLLCGACTAGSVTVSAADTDKIQLVLCGLTLRNPNGPALFVDSADKVFLTLAAGSVNDLSDGADYHGLSDGAESLPDAAVFSRCDLTVNGEGSLTVTGAYRHGVVSKDDLCVTGGALTVTAVNVGLCGHDALKIGGGTLTVKAGSDALRADNNAKENKGYFYLSGGTLTLTAAGDGVTAATVLKMEGGSLTVTAGGGAGTGRNSANRGNRNQDFVGAGTASEKGLKAGLRLLISGGTLRVSAADDALHTNGVAEISGGTLTLQSGNDGIHADSALCVSAGEITVSDSCEGLESALVILSGGFIRVRASDDGVNAATKGEQNRPGAGGSSRLLISGGTLLVDADGDGLDSNGTIEISGGLTLVAGPTSNGNSAFDHDGAATVTGGVLIALGSSGMAEGFDSAENQGAILVSFPTQQAGTPFSLLSPDGRVICSFTPGKAYSSAVVTAPGIEKGKTYTLAAGGTVAGTDENGYAADTTLSGGNTLATVKMSSLLYSSSAGGGTTRPGGNGGGFGGGGYPPGGKRQ